MMREHKPYPDIKESGVPWLGKLPDHWESRRLKHVSSLHGRIGFHGLSSTDYGSVGIIVVSGVNFANWHVDWRRCHRISEHWYEKDRNIQLREGDLLVTKDGTIGKTAIVRDLTERAVLNSGVIVVRPRLPVQYLNKYLLYLINSRAFDGFIDIMRTGATINHLYEATFNNFSIPVPPLPEQAAIVRFLDDAERRIRRYIFAKQNLIKLLEEQRRACIQRAVTRGLDPNVRLKPSGLAWTEQIPEHWSTSALERLTTRIGDGLHGTPEYVDESPYHFINGNNLVSGKVQITQSTSCVSEEEYEKHKIRLDETTLLLSINGTIGSVASYHGELIILGKSAAYINCGDRLSRQYLFFLLRSPEVGNLFRRQATGTTILNLSLESIRHLPTLLPPYKEQAAIASFLERRTSEFTELIRKAGHAIELLREYRTRLIADVVTGKLDVREAAAKLLDEPEESKLPLASSELDEEPDVDLLDGDAEVED